MTKKRTFLRVIVILLSIACALMLLVFALNMYMVRKTEGQILTSVPENAKYDCIIILGAGVREDGSPTLMLKDRLDRGVELYKAGVSDRVLMTGDHQTDEYDEVTPMQTYAIENGVPAEKILIDPSGLSTYESIYRAKEVFGAENVVIVTQKYHMYRALYIAQALDMEATGVSAAEIRYYGQTYRDAREILARVKDMYYSLTQPEPTFAGNTPLTGDITNDN